MADVVTATSIAAGPGAGGSRSARFLSPTQVKIGLYAVTFGDHYLTGGDSFAAVSADFRDVVQVLTVTSTTPGKYLVDYDATNDLLKLYIEDDTSGIYAQAGNDTDQDAVTVTCLVIGY